ncbi:uncharacterized protein V1516DRAFT_622397, partial [Lipomyces oligophaga]|uniref:uncharacterized protein n=1 Tax=Lipomyces oligophaga TaxID=45792 RepID=UPI0034CDB31C
MNPNLAVPLSRPGRSPSPHGRSVSPRRVSRPLGARPLSAALPPGGYKTESRQSSRNQLQFLPEPGCLGVLSTSIPRYLPPSLTMAVTYLREALNKILNAGENNADRLEWSLAVLRLSATGSAPLTAAAVLNDPNESTMRDDLDALVNTALNLLSVIPDSNLPKLIYYKGFWSETGSAGMVLDRGRAFEYYQQASLMGYQRAFYRLGIIYESQERFSEAIASFNRGAEAKDAGCCYALACLYLRGADQLVVDTSRALSYLRIAAENADDEISIPAYIYGLALAGEGKEWRVAREDIHIARLFIEKSAFLGSSTAQVRMGEAYQKANLGCLYDPALSEHYYALAVRRRNSDGMLGLVSWYMTGDDLVEQNYRLAYEYSREAMQLGNPRAYFALAYCYEVGIYITKNSTEAEKWYKQAADLGNADAIARLES